MKVFITDLSKQINCEERFLAHFDLLSEGDKERYFNIANDHRRLQFLVGRMLIAENLKTPVSITKNGKLSAQNMFLSLTHSKNLVMLALDTNPVGIDAEDITHTRDFSKIANRLGFKSQKNAFSFYLEWTKYEADFKLGKTYQNPFHTFFTHQNFMVCLSSSKEIESQILCYESIPFQSSKKLPLEIISERDL